MTMTTNPKLGPNAVFLLSEMLRTAVCNAQAGKKPKKIGRLKDFIIVEEGPLPHVTDLIVERGFGRPDLVFPVASITSIDTTASSGISVSVERIEDWEKPVAENAILLADYVLDKKVIDLEGREISVVFDVRILRVEKLRKMYVTDVEFGKKGLYRRLGLKWLASRSPEDDLVSWAYIQPLPEAIGSFKGDVQLKEVRENIRDMPSVDVADIIEELDADQRTEVFRQLDDESASDALEELEPTVQRQLVSELEPEIIARLINQMTPPQAADILAILPHDDREAISFLLDGDLAAKSRAILEKQEESILHYATDRYIALPETTKVGYVENDYAKLAHEMDVAMYIFVLDMEGRLAGVMDLKEILRAEKNATLGSAMNEHVVSLDAENTLKDAYDMFLRYGYRALPILDEKRKLLGVLKYRDVMNLEHRFVG